MEGRPTLEDNLYAAKIMDRAKYLKKMSQFMYGKETPGLENELRNPPPFVKRDAVKLYGKIMESEDKGHPVSLKKIIKNKNQQPAFLHLIISELIKTEERQYLLIFKRHVIVSKRKEVIN